MANFRLTFPIGGINKSRVPEEQPERTSPDINNMRSFGTADGRLRGEQRPGQKKWGAGTLIGAAEQPVVSMCVVSAVQ